MTYERKEGKFPVLEIRIGYRGQPHTVPGSLEAIEWIDLPEGTGGLEAMAAVYDFVENLRQRFGGSRTWPTGTKRP